MNTLKYPLTTEKSVRLVESENTLTFIVDERANRTSVRKDVETAFKVKVKNVRILKTSKGLKKAFVMLAKQSNALDVATDLGMM
ncbi:50S ribosomal protein L23 [archaeon CG10_big_fil_rev_8_21_14_0_10_43_11]|nr:MAG: 50S ribosomal protein L23 [archaeon CG10_big_fil_rev_8_21_14_0_10_43_11]